MKYKDKVKPAKFTPAVVEVHGHLHGDFDKIMDHISETALDNSPECSSLTENMRAMIKSNHLARNLELLSVAVQKGVAACYLLAANHLAKWHGRCGQCHEMSRVWAEVARNEGIVSIIGSNCI